MPLVPEPLTDAFVMNEVLTSSRGEDTTSLGPSGLITAAITWREVTLTDGVFLESITWNGSENFVFHALAVTGAVIVERWALPAPSLAAANIVLTFAEVTPGSGAKVIAAVCYVFWTGADRITPLGTAVSATGTDTAPTVVVPATSPANYVCDVIGYPSLLAFPTLVVGAGQAEEAQASIIAATTGFRITGASSDEPAIAGNVTMDWTTAPDIRSWVSLGCQVFAAGRVKDPIHGPGVVPFRR